MGIKFCLTLAAVGLFAGNAGATVTNIYNTGYSTSLNGGGQLVDNLWTVTQLQSLPSGYTFPTPPYAAFSYPTPPVWDNSAPPPGGNSFTTTWDSNANPLFAGIDTNGMVTTYTLNFSAIAGSYTLYFEADNYVSMYLGSTIPANLFYSESPQDDFLGWQSVTVNVGTSGPNQLNILAFNTTPNSFGNFTGWRANFSTVDVPEPSTLALVVGGLGALFGAAKRRSKN